MGLFSGSARVEPSAQLPPRCDACGAVSVPVESVTKEGVPLTICVDARDCRRRWQARETLQAKGIRG